MSYKTELQGNNTDLQTILDKVNALPDAGGATLKTCAVSIKVQNGSTRVHYTGPASDGGYTACTTTLSSGTTATINAVQGTAFFVELYRLVITTMYNPTGVELISYGDDMACYFAPLNVDSGSIEIIFD